MSRYQITRGRAFGQAMLKALGYDTDVHAVKSLTVMWRADGPPLIRITEYATAEQEERLVALVADQDGHMKAIS